MPLPLTVPHRDHAAGGWHTKLLMLATAAVMTAPARSVAQQVNLDFPAAAASGYDQQLGVTVLSRPRPLYDAPGIRLDGFDVRPNLDQSVAYNTDPTGSSSGHGSFVSQTAANLSVASLWPRDSFAAVAGVDHYSYFALPGADYTDWNVGLRGGYTIADSQVTAAYSHYSYHQIGSNIGTTRSDTPVADTTDTADLYYTFKLNPIEIIPEFSASAYRYGAATASGLQINQQYLDRNVLALGVTTRYAINDIGGVVLVVRAVDTLYVHGLVGAASNNSRTYQVLTGLDYQAEGPWRYRLLVGAEVNAFAAAQMATRLEPVVQGDVTWVPTGLTTLYGQLSRSYQSPLAAGTDGFFETQASLRVDHELMRNVIAQGRGGLQYAQYLGGGTQNSANVGGGVNWLLNRSLRLSFDYDFIRQSAATGIPGSHGVNAPSASQVSQSVAALVLHLSL